MILGKKGAVYMNKYLKGTLVAFIAILVIGGFGAWYYFSQKEYYNEDGTTGNTAGNLYNGGFFCEYDGVIYFSNPSDDGALYSMSSDCGQVKKISGDKVASINADGHYIYYSRRNYARKDANAGFLNFQSSGLYRITKNNGKLLLLLDCKNDISCLFGNTIYFRYYDDANKAQLYQVGIDGKNAGLVSKEPLIPASVRDDTLFYAGESSDHYLHGLDLANNGDYVYSYNFCYMPIAMPGWIYYISTQDNYSICRVGYDGSEPETLVSEFCTTYNITEDERYLFYQIDGGGDNRIVCLDLKTGVSTTLIDGDYNQIHVTSKYVFFRDFADTTTYAYKLSDGTLSTFHPPVLD